MTNGKRWQAGVFAGYAESLGSRHEITGAAEPPSLLAGQNGPGGVVVWFAFQLSEGAAFFAVSLAYVRGCDRL